MLPKNDTDSASSKACIGAWIGGSGYQISHEVNRQVLNIKHSILYPWKKNGLYPISLEVK